MSRLSTPSLVALSFSLSLAWMSAGPASAGTLDLELVADGNGRWFELFSDAFAQVDGGPSYQGAPGFDGAYQASFLPNFVTIGGGLTAFPFGANWGKAGELTVDDAGLSGSGTEQAPITGIEVQFDQFVADNDAITGDGYSTTFSEVSGTVTYSDGTPISIDLTSTVTMAYDFQGFGGPVFEFTGSFDITEGRFDLDVSEPIYQTKFGDVGYQWDITGQATAVPEPGAAVAAASCLLVIAAMRRTRGVQRMHS